MSLPSNHPSTSHKTAQTNALNTHDFRQVRKKEKLTMAFHKQRDLRSTNTRAQGLQPNERADDSFDQFDQFVEENEGSKASRRDRRLSKRLYKRDPYAE